MEKYYRDVKYYRIISDILENDKFKKMDGYRHHGMTRLDHSLKVSYYAYRIAVKFRLDYVSVARAGLLHDFFLNEDLNEIKQRFSMFFHPYKSLENTCKYFNVNDMEKDIIITHMFPTLPHKVPKYLESWLVSFVDKVIAAGEFYESYARPYAYKLSNLYLMLLIFKG